MFAFCYSPHSPFVVRGKADLGEHIQDPDARLGVRMAVNVGMVDCNALCFQQPYETRYKFYFNFQYVILDHLGHTQD